MDLDEARDLIPEILGTLYAGKYAVLRPTVVVPDYPGGWVLVAIPRLHRTRLGSSVPKLKWRHPLLCDA